MITIIKNKIIDIVIASYKLVKAVFVAILDFIKDLYQIIRYWN